MRQVALFRTDASLNPNLTSYMDLLGGCGSGLNVSETAIKAIAPCSGVLRNIYVGLSAAPGSAKTWTFTPRVGGIDVGEIVIADSQTSGRYALDIPITAGQLVSMRADPTNEPDGSQRFLAYEFAGLHTGESLYAAGGGTLNTVTPRYTGVFNPSGENWNDDDPAFVYNVAACPGYITAMYGYLSSGILSGGAYRWTIVRKAAAGGGFVDQDGTGGTPNTVLELVPGPGEVVGNVTFQLRVERGDLFYIRSDRIEGDIFEPPTRQCSVGIRFKADRDGESQFCSTVSTLRTDTTPEFNAIRASDVLQPWNTTETQRDVFGGFTTFGLKDLHVVLENPPSAGSDHLFVARVNQADQDLTVTLADDQVFAADLINRFFVRPGDRLSMRHLAGNTPDAGTVAIGMTQVIGPVIGPLAWVHFPRTVP